MAGFAKLSPPRMAGVWPREQLFARLDSYRADGAAVWISGPPGAGKTTLAASWVASRGLHCLWYQVDRGDADPASLFHYLAIGARAAGLSKRVHLPQLSPEYLGDLEGFTRRWFRQLFAGLPRECVLVFDSLHEGIGSGAGQIPTTLEEVPDGITLLLVSRTEPRAGLARLRASRTLAVIGWDELRLTDDEATAIAAPRVGRDAAGMLARRCGGWAAGLTLLLEHALATGSVEPTPTSREKLFDYFAAELFDRLPLTTREVLLTTALLPWVEVEAAKALSGNDNAGTMLEALRRERLFVERREGSPSAYVYHALLREFLQDRIEACSSVDERKRLADVSARLLAKAGDVEAALPLHLLAEDEPAAVELVLGNAPAWAAQGRLRTLAGWIAQMPARWVDEEPWLGYWLGVCTLATNPLQARSRFEAAFTRFAGTTDRFGQVLSAAGIIETYNLEMRDLRPAAPWARALLDLLDGMKPFSQPGVELNVLGSLLGALAMLDPAHPRLTSIADRIEALLDSALDVSACVAGACRLLHYYMFRSGTGSLQQLIGRIRPRLADPRLASLPLCNWLLIESTVFQLFIYDEGRGKAAIDLAQAIAVREGFFFYQATMHIRASTFRLEAGEVDAAAALLALGTPATGGPRFDGGWYDGHLSWLALLQGRPEAAVDHARRLIAVCEQIGGPRSEFMALIWLANAVAANGDPRRAADTLARARGASVTREPIEEFSADIVAADLALAATDLVHAEALLRHGLALASRERFFNTMQWLAPQMSRLCAFALERGIESEYVTELIRLRRLCPPSPDTIAWPWPVLIRCLGGFEVLRDGRPLRVEGKSQRRPLALLQALAVLGGRDVREDRLIGIIWADLVNGDTQKAFDIALHRLRKLLGHEQAITVSDRCVSLNRELVWCDLWATEQRLGVLVPAGGTLVDEAALEAAGPQILDLHRGPLLQGEPDAAWLMPARNRLAGRFQRFVIRLGERFETQRRWPDAQALYQRAIEVEPFAELFHARLMVCLSEQGCAAEAIEVYRRCRRTLAVALGTQPSQNTEAIYRELGGA